MGLCPNLTPLAYGTLFFCSTLPLQMTDLKALCNGHIFSLYSPAAHLPGGFSKSEVFLFYRPGTLPTFAAPCPVPT